MTIPTFKSASTFSVVFNAPCMVSRIKQSTIPGIGKLCSPIVDGHDVFIEVVLVGGESARVSEWHQMMLERLFTREELVVGIKAGIQAMENSRSFDGYDEDALAQMGVEGLINWTELGMILLDDKRHMIRVTAATEVDENLSEHGMTFYWQDEQWFWSEDRDDLYNFMGAYPVS